MNKEVVRKLYWEATQWCEDNAIGTPVAWEFEEKFAELVAIEAISVLQNHLQGHDDISSKWVYHHIVSPVKEHFGVK
jgi:hypothetical protein